eukprot:NODE_909_length_3117_cov_0.336978.p2 type:complete len:269 gc:universal NODE_909_length_3117_cov_0.336978:1805-2611(+)
MTPQHDFAVDDSILIVGLILSYISFLISIYSIYKLYMRMDFKWTRFHLLMWIIVILELMSSLLFFIQNICDSKSFGPTYCTPIMQILTEIMWITGYVIIFLLLLNAVNKYKAVKSLYHWKYNLKYILQLVGFAFLMTIIIIRLFYPDIRQRTSKYTILAYLVYVYFFDALMEILLIKILFHSRSRFFKMPTNVKNAYLFTRHSITTYLLIIPVLIVSFLNTSDNPNLFHLFQYIIYTLLSFHIYFNISSMIFIRMICSINPTQYELNP